MNEEHRAWAVHYGPSYRAATFDHGNADRMAAQLHGTIHAMIYTEDMMQLDPRSERNLQGVNHLLVDVVHRAADIVADMKTGLGFVVTEGLRTMQRQAELVNVGASQTMNSKHLVQPDGTGHAVDLAATLNGSVRWDFPLYDKLAAAMKQAAKEQGVQIEWGGDWHTFKDGPHFQLADQPLSA